ncbi:ABC transporter [Tractidigestivibacter scatoligenes]|uniref:ABC-type quaternary amine transporter n=1 Tax=Tractidigestivibacter scatoligenes TaxID=1299998 RepID=A0A124EGU7_TRASO|nr:ABC transporter ATP-binding protein [Tractidigestivibacter scatoligenes]KUH58573.1 ABC transporter [Tractidigestivibacter scatoligenes]
MTGQNTDSNAAPKLSAHGIAKSFDGREVLHGISFDVLRGEFLSILGPSGCGKSTILRILIGLEHPDAGCVLLDGKDITDAAPSKRHMGIVFQDYALFENMTVLGNVEYALRFDPTRRECRTKIALEALASLGMADYANKPVAGLSGGQMQRVSIARTLALSPEVILFDEPTSGLDADARLALRSQLKKIQRDHGTTMVFITHDQEEAFALADRVMVMGEGSIHQLDEPLRIVENPADGYVRDFVVSNLKAKYDSLARFASPLR